MTTIDLLPLIAEHNDSVLAFTFHSYPPQTLIQDRIAEWGKKEQNMFDFAMKMRNKYHVPFWDGIMLSTFENQDVSEKVMFQTLLHNRKHDLRSLRVDDLEKLILLPLDCMALSSVVELVGGSIGHLPMLDFHIPVSESNLRVVEMVCRLLKLNAGWIIESGESYHFIGMHPVDWKNVQQMLCRAIMFSPIVDRAWVSHQLLEQSCSLRIGRKHGLLPVVIKSLPGNMGTGTCFTENQSQ